MKPKNSLAYQRELALAAKRLGLRVQGDLEKALIDHAVGEVRKWMIAHGQPTTLSVLLEQIAVSFSLEIVEIEDNNDLYDLLERIPPTREPVLARLADELDDDTDAVILQRQNHEPWEMPYLAAINCRGRHHSRRYFSKWHEVVHLLLDGRQLRFAFRKTSAGKKNPEEMLVDNIAGVVAFHPDLFEPVLTREIHASGALTFDVVERARVEVAPDASFESTVYACVRTCSEPICFLKARMGYKEREKQELNDLLSGLDGGHVPQPRLRVQVSSATAAASRLGVRFHENMQVPETSLVAKAFAGYAIRLCGREPLSSWQTSQGGPIGIGEIEVEATRRGEDVCCLVRLLPGVKTAPTARTARKPRQQV